MRRLLLAVPLLIVVVMGAFFFWGLNPDRDPNAVPSALISQPAPDFDLGPLDGAGVPGLSKADLVGRVDVSVVNVFASWCLPCRAEHPMLTRLAREEGFDLMGINYLDQAKAAAEWLEELGNPYVRIGFDLQGRAGIDWGITGVPETFIVAPDGTVVWRFAGPIVDQSAQTEFRTALAQARAKYGAGS
ncbi:DsbE family thiol:disulfide interchange protein [Roseobacteraceae bacterium S113]